MFNIIVYIEFKNIQIKGKDNIMMNIVLKFRIKTMYL